MMNMILGRLELTMPRLYWMAIITAGLFIVGCADTTPKAKKPVFGTHSKVQPETTESIKSWIDSQSAIQAPGVVELDVNIFEYATIEDDRLRFETNKHTKWLLDLFPHMILHGYSLRDSQTVLRRIKSIKEVGSAIEIQTKPAMLDELYLKLESGAPVRNPLDGTEYVRANELVQKSQKLENQTWNVERNFFTITVPQVKDKYGVCVEVGEEFGGRHAILKECGVGFDRNVENDPVYPIVGGAVAGGVAFEGAQQSSLTLGRADFTAEVSFLKNSEDPDEGEILCGCIAKHYVPPFVLSEEQPSCNYRPSNHEVIYDPDAAPFVCINADAAEDSYAACKKLPFGWEEHYIETAYREMMSGVDTTGMDDYQKYLQQISHYYKLIGEVSQDADCVGTGKLYGYSMDFEVDIKVDPFLLMFFGQLEIGASGGALGTKEDGLARKILPKFMLPPIPAGPVVITSNLSIELVFKALLEGAIGLEFAGDSAPRLRLTYRVGMDWEEGDEEPRTVGEQVENEQHSGASFNLGWPGVFGQIAASIGFHLPVELTVALYDAAGLTFKLEPYANLGMSLRASSNEDVDNSCELGLKVGAIGEIGGVLQVPYLGQLARLKRALVSFNSCDEDGLFYFCYDKHSSDVCKPTSNNQWLKVEMSETSEPLRSPQPDGERWLDINDIWVEDKQGAAGNNLPMSIWNEDAQIGPATVLQPPGSGSDAPKLLDDLENVAGEKACVDRNPTQSEWEEIGLVMKEGDTIYIKFARPIIATDILHFNRKFSEMYCKGGGTPKVSIGDKDKNIWGAAYSFAPGAIGKDHNWKISDTVAVSVSDSGSSEPNIMLP